MIKLFANQTEWFARVPSHLAGENAVENRGNSALVLWTIGENRCESRGKQIRGESVTSPLRRWARESKVLPTKFAEQLPAQLLGRRSRLWRCDPVGRRFGESNSLRPHCEIELEAAFSRRRELAFLE